MKKFKSLLMLGAMATASSMAWAQGTSSNTGCVSALPTEATVQSYAFTTPRGALIGTESQYLQATCLPANNSAYEYDLTNKAFQFLLFPAEGQTSGYYIYSVGAEKFLGARTTASTKSGNTAGVAPMTTDAPAVYYIWQHGVSGSDGDGYGRFNYNKQEWPWTIGSQVRVSGDYSTINMTYWNNGVGYDFGNTSGIDGGNAYAVIPAEEVSDEIYQAAYNILHPTPVGPSAEDIATLQANIDAIKDTFGKVGYPKNAPAETVTEDNYAEALAAYNAYLTDANVNMPEEGKYYEIKAAYHNGTRQYLAFNGTKLVIADEKPATGSATFKAESVEGSNVVLSVADKYVHWTSGDDPGKSSDTDGVNEELAAINTLTLAKATAGNNTPKATNENLFGLLQIQGAGTNGNKYYFVTRNDLNGTGAFVAAGPADKFFDTNWNGDGHNRTTYFEFTEVEAPTLDAPATEAEISAAQELLWNAGRLGYPVDTDPVVAALSATVFKSGVLKSELDAAVLDFNTCTNVVVPAKNRFYRFTGRNTAGILGGGTSGNAKMLTNAAESSPYDVVLGSLYYYSEEGYLINYDGGRALKGSTICPVGQTPSVFTFTHESMTDPGTLCIKTDDDKFILDQFNNAGLSASNVGAGTNWEIEDYGYAPINVGETGFATVCLPYSVAANPEYNITAVYVVSEEAEMLKATAIDYIPANIPVIVEAEPNTRCFGKGYGEDNYQPEGEVAAAIASNVLSGTICAIAKPENALVLGQDEDGEIGFYGLEGTVLAGFKAYYELPADAASAKKLVFGENTLTAIESAIETAKGQAIFDLQGRRVSGAAHGLFIQNGKKVVR